MMTFSLTEEERDVLQQTVGLYLKELKMEMMVADNWEMRAALKRKHNILDGIDTALEFSLQKSAR